MLLTGAAGGIGRVMTQALLADGHQVAAVDRDAASLERLKALLRRQRERLHADPSPISAARPAACGRSRRRASASAPIEAVINNAGIGMSAIRPDAEARHPGIEELTPEIFDRFFDIFVRAPVTLVARRAAA